MLEDSVADLDGQIQPAAVILELLNDTHRLSIVVEATLHEFVQRRFPRMTKCGMTEVVAEPDRLGEGLVEAKRLGDGPADLRYFQHVRQARPVVVSLRCEKHLRLVLQSPERFAVDDPVAIALVGRAQVIFGLGAVTTACLRAPCSLGSERVVLDAFEHLTDVHEGHSSEGEEGIVPVVAVGEAPTTGSAVLYGW